MNNFEMDFPFPQAIGVGEAKEAQLWKEIGTSWVTMQNSSMVYKFLHNEPMLKDICNFVDSCVNSYVETMNYPDKYECTESWAHSYKIGGYQPWHAHGGNTISAVYIVAANKDKDTFLHFKNPIGADMLNPYNITPYKEEKIKVHASAFSEWSYPSIPGRCYVFRSFMEHSTDVKTNKDDRIVFAFNYNKVGHLFKPQL